MKVEDNTDVLRSI